MFSTDPSEYFILSLSPTHCFQVLKAKIISEVKLQRTQEKRNKGSNLKKKVKLEKKYRLFIAIHRHLHPTTECKMERL